MAPPTTPSQKPKPSFAIVLRPKADIDHEQATRAIRQILKEALRRHGLRCVDAKMTQEPDPDPDAPESLPGPESEGSTAGGIET